MMPLASIYKDPQFFVVELMMLLQVKYGTPIIRAYWR